MIRRFLGGLLLSGLLVSHATAEDLYTVTLHSHADAGALRSASVRPVLRAGNTYVVLCDGDATADLAQRGLDFALLVRSVGGAELAIDHRRDRAHAERYPVLFERDHLRLLRVPPDLLGAPTPPVGLMPVGQRRVRVLYEEPRHLAARRAESSAAVPLDSIAGLVQEDSVSAYLHRLQAFFRRVAGTDSCNAARDWLESRFQSYGYDSIYVDSFATYPGAPVLPYANLVVTKVGTTYPDIQIVVGGHFDGVSTSPAADDNGTGTVGTLEIARVLSGFETDVTLVFIAFDAEESGLWGSWHYADEAASRGDGILAMWNMDMIGHVTNTNSARIYHGANSHLAQRWIGNAVPLVGIVGYLQGQTGASDHLPFDQNGFAAYFLQEYNFSTVYHSGRDSTSFINFNYLTRMIKASAATIYAAAVDVDLDGDGVANEVDNCLVIANGAQVDADGDGIGDPCDNCPGGYNPDQADLDLDQIGDLCDVCPADATNDGDHDGTCENNDNCPGVWNAGQEDKDGNGTGDACQYTPPSYAVYAEAAGDSLGFRVSCSGDVNGDGFDDILAGAPGSGIGHQGEAYLFSGADGALLVRITGEASGDMFGFSVAIVPDLDGDGKDEMCAGAPRHSSVNIYAGKAYLFMAPAGPYPLTLAAGTAADHIFSGTSLAQFVGTAVAAIGDVDGDTTADIAVGAAPLVGVINPGEVHVYSGRTRTLLYTVAGAVAADWFGYDVEPAGDVNDDGHQDFIVGSPGDYQSGSEAGRAYVFSGLDGALLRELIPDATHGRFGSSVAGVGDLNGDGFDDIMVGAPLDPKQAFRAGRATVFSGQDGSVLYTFWGHAPGDGAGVSVGGAADLNVDSVPDLFVGGFTKGYGGKGRVELYSGKDGAILHTFLGDEAVSGFGTDFSGAGDLDGDGVRDLVVGAFLEDYPGYDGGEIFVFALGDDPDADGISGVDDNCPMLWNPAQADFDGDGRGDPCDACPSFATPHDGWFMTGDVNSDWTLTIADVLLVVEYLFKGGVPATPVALCADADCSRRVTAADLVYLINYVFKGGADPCDVCALGP